MINIRKAIIGVATAVLALASVSCQKDDTLYYNNMTMGNIVDGRFVSDQGNTFNFVENLTAGISGEQKRILTLCDVLKPTAGASNEYDVRLTLYYPVLDKKPVALEDAAEGDIAVQDPVHIEQLWFSGGYVNMMIRNVRKSGSDVKHLINLVYSKDEEGKYVMNLRHNAFGEVYSAENASQMVLSEGTYVSFPIADIISEDKAKIVFDWKWYLVKEMEYDLNIEQDYTFEYEWERPDFIQNF